jgi:hypothetical protein
MTKRFIFSAALVILAIAGFIVGSAAVNAQQDKVAVTETVLEGDKSAAKGITVSHTLQVENRLFWDVTQTPETGETKTKFTYTGDAVYETDTARIYGGLELNIGTNFGTYSDAGLDVYNYGYGEIIKAAADMVEHGETKKLRLKLSDYYDYFPIYMWMDIPANYAHYGFNGVDSTETTAVEMSYLSQRFGEDFKAAVPENCVVTIEITKSSDGTVTGVEFNQDGGPWVTLDQRSVANETGCWFTVSNLRDDYGRDVDWTATPAGLGVYYMPYIIVDDTAELTEDIWEMFYPFENGEKAVWMRLSDDGTKLLLLTETGGRLTFTALDAASGQMLQTMELMDWDDDVYLNIGYYSDGLLVFGDAEGNFRVVTENDGAYTAALSGNFGDMEDYLTGHDSMDYDGTRLAVLSPDSEYGSDGCCGWHLAVYDESGMTYMSAADVSLDTENLTETTWTGKCRPLGNSSAVVRLNS